MLQVRGNIEPQNLIHNGRFYGNLDDWDGTASINRSIGYPRNGCAQIDAGESITQDVGLTADALYTLHYMYRLASGAALTAGYGSTTQAHTGEQQNVWHEARLEFALDASANDNVTFSAAGGTVYIDAVSLRIGAIPATRGEAAAVVHRRLGTLATEKGLDTCADQNGPNGDYTDAIDEALRATGACGNYGEPDITRVQTSEVNTLLDAIYAAMLQHLQSSYALDSGRSTWLGPRKEQSGDIVQNIAALIGGGGTGRGAQETLYRANGWNR